MSENKHTPEPWSIFGKDNHIMGNQFEDAMERGIEHSQWTHNCTPEDARRITACVNACAGIPISDLESGDFAKSLKMFALESATFRRQHDELLAACDALLEWDFVRGFRLPYKVRDPIIAAIVSVKGEQ